MGGIEWGMWANENAMASSFVTFIGGVIAVAGRFNMWQIGVYAIIISLFILLVEYPRSKRQKGRHNYDRLFQYPVSVVVSKGGLFTRNYFIRFVFYLVASVPCCFLLPSLLGALCMMATSFVYLAAGINNEEWQPIPLKKSDQGPKVIAEPTRPPPRRPELPAGGDQLRRQEDSRV